MTKHFILLFVVLFSFSQSVWANSCELNYQRVYFDRTAEFKMAKLSHEKVDEFLLRIENEMLFDKEKIDAIDDVYSALSGYYYKKMKVIEDLANNPRSQIGEEMISVYEKQFAADAIREIAPYNNRMIKNLLPFLEKKGIPVKIGTREFLNGEVKTNYLILDTSEISSYESVKKIQMYQKRFGTKFVTFDLFQNIQNGSGGFSIATQSRIDLGMSGIKSILNDDLVTMVGKHEFRHANFASMRAKGQKSIYHSSYIATGRANISSVENHYKRYMSAEELYNFSNNPWWGSSRLRDPSKYSLNEIFDEIDSLSFYIKSTTKIAKQTDEVSRSFIRYLDDASAKIKEGKHVSLEFLNSKNELSQNAEDLFSVGFVKEDGVAMIHYIDDELLPYAQRIQKKQMELIGEYNAKIANEFNPIQVEKLKEEFLERSVKGVEEDIEYILRAVRNDQEKLAKVAKTVELENLKLEKRMENFVEEVQVAYKLTPDFYLAEHWKIKFEGLTNDFRRFGNLVKENYKGFAGH